MATVKTHHYKATIKWTGNKGSGTSNYQDYNREHIISIDSKNNILGSSDPDFRGDKTKHNPEDLLISSLSACHMLWYLHLCSQAGVVVTDYIDDATGIMIETKNGGGNFTEVTLNPIVTVTEQTMPMNFIKRLTNFALLQIQLTFQCFTDRQQRQSNGRTE